MKLKEAHILVDHFAHCEKGDVFETPAGNKIECPGDAVFCRVTVDGREFAVSLVAVQGENDEPVKPWHFEACLRGTLATLHKHIGAPQDDNVKRLETVDAPDSVQ